MVMLSLFGILFLLIFLSVPIGISVGISTIVTVIFFTDSVQPLTLSQQFFTSLDSFPIMAIPFFMLSGIMMGKGGISKRLLAFAGALIGFIRAGLAMMTVVACMFFSAISGSGPATVAAIGSFVIPAMTKENYGRGYASALTASAGSIGIIIPPSIPFVLYGVVGNVSIGELFLAGILPGVMIGCLLMGVSYLIFRRTETSKSLSQEEVVAATLDTEFSRSFDLKNVWKTFYDAKWALLTPVIILGGIYGSVFTPTEAAAVACVYAFIICNFIYKELSWTDAYDSVVGTLKIIGATTYMISLSIAFSYILSIENIPQNMANFITDFSSNPYVLISLIIVFLLIVGAFIDTIAAIVILTPILLPIATQVGYDPVHFGVIMVVALAIGFVTPPVGANLFVASSIGNVSIEKISKAMVPFFIILLISLFIISFLPFLSLYLPSFM